MNEFRVYSGEAITISLVLVGHDFGATAGTVHANFMHQSPTRLHASHLCPDQYHQWVPKTVLKDKVHNLLSQDTRDFIPAHNHCLCKPSY